MHCQIKPQRSTQPGSAVAAGSLDDPDAPRFFAGVAEKTKSDEKGGSATAKNVGVVGEIGRPRAGVEHNGGDGPVARGRTCCAAGSLMDFGSMSCALREVVRGFDHRGSRTSTCSSMMGAIHQRESRVARRARSLMGRLAIVERATSGEGRHHVRPSPIKKAAALAINQRARQQNQAQATV